MAHVGPASTPVVASVPGPAYVEWGAIFAGAVLAAALSFVFLTFGAAIGLSAASPWPNSGASVKFIAGLAVFWTMVQQIGAFIAGRLHCRPHALRWRLVGRQKGGQHRDNSVPARFEFAAEFAERARPAGPENRAQRVQRQRINRYPKTECARFQ